MSYQLYYAVMWQYPEKALTLIERGADVRYVYPPDGSTALHWAVNLQGPRPIQPALVQALIDKGADVNACTYLKRTPWNQFCRHLDKWDAVTEQKAEILLRAGADITKRDVLGCTGMEFVAEYPDVYQKLRATIDRCQAERGVEPRCVVSAAEVRFNQNDSRQNS